MDKFEKRIKELAESYSGFPEEFMFMLEKMLEKVPAEDKGDLWLWIGNILYSLSYFKLSVRVWNNALEYFIETHNRQGESDCYGNLGLTHYNLGDFRKAIEYREKSLEIARKIGDKAGESHSYTGLGNAYYSLSDFRKAIEYHEKSLEIARKIGDKAGEARCYGNLGNSYHFLGDFRKAIKDNKKSLGIYRRIGDRAGEALCYIGLGNSYHSLGNFNKAIEDYKESLRIYKGIGDRVGEAKCYGNLGLTYHSLGDFRKAIEYHEKSLGIKRKIGYEAGESHSYTGLGNAYYSLSDFRKAIEYHEKSLEIARRIGDKAGEAHCYTNLGLAYISLGDSNKAIENNKKSLRIYKGIGDRVGEAKSYTNLGAAYHSLGNFRKAVDKYKKSLGIARKIGYKAGEVHCYTGLGNAYHSLGNFRKAVDKYKKSLGIARKIGFKAGESHCYTGLGNAYHRLGDFKKAIDCFDKSLEIKREIGDIDGEIITTLNLAVVYGDHLNKPELAYNNCRNSIRLSEYTSGKLVEEEQAIGFSSRISVAYHYMVPLCLKLKKEVEAFEYMEQSKSRVLLDLLAFTDIKPNVKLTPKLKSLLAEEESYLLRLREIQTRHLRRIKVSVETGEVERTIGKLNIIYGKIEKYDPEYVFTRRGNPLSLVKIGNMLSSQERNTVLIEYFLTKENLFIFVVPSKDKKLYIEKVQISLKKITPYIENYWRSVARYPDCKDIRDSWLTLSEYLIAPVSKYLTEGDLIYFVPFGTLHYLPLHALALNGEPLIKQHPVAYSPSASLIRFCKNKGSGKLESCVSMGVAFQIDEETEFEERAKELNKAEKEKLEKGIKEVKKIFEGESKNIADLFKGKPITGSAVTKAQVKKTCVDKDVIHFSCHGHFNVLDPLSSGIKMYDGVLTAREIFDLKLNTELVTLSACETGISDRKSGDELIGLTRAFLYAGAPSIIVSLWKVDASSTRELMLQFYKFLKKGKDKATALQEAQKKIMAEAEYSNPCFWAPFILVGDWQ